MFTSLMARQLKKCATVCLIQMYRLAFAVLIARREQSVTCAHRLLPSQVTTGSTRGWL